MSRKLREGQRGPTWQVATTPRAGRLGRPSGPPGEAAQPLPRGAALGGGPGTGARKEGAPCRPRVAGHASALCRRRTRQSRGLLAPPPAARVCASPLPEAGPSAEGAKEALDSGAAMGLFSVAFDHLAPAPVWDTALPSFLQAQWEDHPPSRMSGAPSNAKLTPAHLQPLADFSTRPPAATSPAPTPTPTALLRVEGFAVIFQNCRSEAD